MENQNIQYRSYNFCLCNIAASYIYLNKRGYANFQATVYPFQKTDYDKLQLELIAVMEGKDMMDVGSGETTLRFKVPAAKTRTIRINAITGGAIE